MKQMSINNRFIVDAYIGDRTIKTSEGTGRYGLIQQKVNLIGLRLLVDVRQLGHTVSVNGGFGAGDYQQTTHVIPRDSMVYVREEALLTQPWAKQHLECPAIEGKFMIVDQQYIEFVQYP